MESVGSGGMGVVWRAQDERLERTVAIKQLFTRPGLPESEAEDARRRAMREARTAARLQHRNAIALFDVADHDGNPWLIMEFLRSRSLSAVLSEQGPLPPVEVGKIGAQVAAALTAAHEAGIVHRDVKPANVLLDDTGLVKITDFGISRTLGDATITQTGMLAGTPAYLAPEVARGNQPGRESDVFALGATLYHAVEGSPPFGTNSNPLALLHAVASGNVPPPRNAGPLTAVLMHMLRAEPSERPTMAEAATSLENLETRRIEVGEQLTVPVRQPEPPPVGATRTLPRPATPPPGTPSPAPAGPGRSSRRTVLVVVLVLAFAVAGVITAMLINSARQPTGGIASNTSTGAPPSTSAPSAGSSAPVVPVSGPIDWSQAGRLVIDYYSGAANPQATWAMLSDKGRAAFGDEQKFQQYWAQFKQVSARNARGVTPNPDGSVNVPVDVTYTGQDGADKAEHRVLRVVIQEGRLAIDSEAR
ncbi:serine/threonine-protein kinase [Actinophytocola sp.]|uniref:serine/threonine-protein kinase n=1 Tax=Actinophytocola sp. TaxID=1872138 RepID=UPI002D7E95A0|nr:serine/threonine-protein kinase [Actinophytocola sp.]HET9138598.1 serine/threonine-protein kinase [Actinophytocola sp.]